MKICFFGSSLVSSYWNGAATYYRGMLKEIAALGHDVTFYESDAFERQANRDIADPPWARVSVYPATAEGWQYALSQAARSADQGKRRRHVRPRARNCHRARAGKRHSHLLGCRRAGNPRRDRRQSRSS